MNTTSVPLQLGQIAVCRNGICLEPAYLDDQTFNVVAAPGGQQDPSRVFTMAVSNQAVNTTQTMNTGAQTGSRTLSWPVLAGNDTIAALAVAQTYTAVNTFSNATDATALGTGAVVISAGGLSVNGQARIGGAITVNGSVNFAGGPVISAASNYTQIGGTTVGAKFNSQGATISTAGIPSIFFNDSATARPEIGWIRGGRTYPEFSIREATSADTGGAFWAGNGTAQPAEIMDIITDHVAILPNTASAGVGTGALVVTGGISGGASLNIQGQIATANGPIIATTTSGSASITANGATTAQFAANSTSGFASFTANASSGSSAIFQMSAGGTGLYSFSGTATNLQLKDLANTTTWATYTPGTLALATFAFAGTLANTSSTAGTVTIGTTGTAATCVAIGGGNINAGGSITAQGGLFLLAGQIDIQSVSAAATNDTTSHIYRTNGSGSGDFSTSGNVIIQPRTATATPMDFIVYTGATTGVERLRVISTGVVRLGGAAAPSANTFTGNIIWGGNTAAAATAGQVGEDLTSTVTGATPGANTVTANVTSKSLTAGTYYGYAVATIHSGTTGLTAGGLIKLSITSTTGADGTSGSTMVQQTVFGTIVASSLDTISIIIPVFGISATTTYFATMALPYSAGSPTVDITLAFIRVR